MTLILWRLIVLIEISNIYLGSEKAFFKGSAYVLKEKIDGNGGKEIMMKIFCLAKECFWYERR